MEDPITINNPLKLSNDPLHLIVTAQVTCPAGTLTGFQPLTVVQGSLSFQTNFGPIHCTGQQQTEGAQFATPVQFTQGKATATVLLVDVNGTVVASDKRTVAIAGHQP